MEAVFGIVAAVLACLAAWLFMARGSGGEKPVTAPSAEVRAATACRRVAHAVCAGMLRMRSTAVAVITYAAG